MSFFKKKRFSEVEGYERISRMIEDRQRELTGDGGEEGDEDTVVLTAQARGGRSDAPRTERADDDEVVSLIRPTEQRPASSVEPTVRLERADFGPPVAPAGAPAMPVPEAPALQGGASLVSKDAVWDGKLVSTGDIRIEGVLQGEIETSGALFVAANARVQATVRAKNIVLAGEIEGHVRCEGRLEILPGGSARGEIDTGALVVHEGAFIESRFQMHTGPRA
ncbi:MAG: polymer-forming cytoskeletal protein [Dehalococcoidia bacterium]